MSYLDALTFEAWERNHSPDEPALDDTDDDVWCRYCRATTPAACSCELECVPHPVFRPDLVTRIAVRYHHGTGCGCDACYADDMLSGRRAS